MRMRNIALTGMVLVILTTLGCSKKTEEHANETQMAPAPAAQETAPAPMQSMDQGMDSESSNSPGADTNTTETQNNGQEEPQGGHESSGME